MKTLSLRKPATRARKPFLRPAAAIASGVSVMAGCLLATSAQAENAAAGTSLLGDKTEITVGAGLSVMPRYLGSSETRVAPIPVIAVQRGIFFADVLRGAGAEYQTESGFYISGAVGYDEGRKTRNTSWWRQGSKRLTGMGDVKGSTTFNLVAAQQLTPWLSVTAAGEFALEGQKNRGNQYRLGFHADLLDNDKDSVSLALNAHAGDRDYNRTYFGVTDAQSQTSRFSRHNAGSGIYGYSLTGSWTHSFDKHWSVTTAVSVMQLTGDAGRSPLVQEKTAVTGLATVNYNFDL
ncbi:MipA/OmpV family protein [Burkholderia vietnamiensis]|uniref:MipA/OmpV family protein n=1 Tax=Burkholderia vietnamiensis TaxID=60552 RepID=UPI0015930C4B|nr:MipA/OmpV family protein [Burkholderia vietnamiensis]